MIRENAILRFFPPPKFLEMPAAGLDLSDRSVKYLELVRRGSGAGLGRFGEKEIPAGIIEGGVVKNPEELSKILSALQKETGLEYLAVSLPEEKAYLVMMELRGVDKKGLREAIELSLEEHVPIPAADAVFDYEVVGNGGETSSVAVSVFPRDVAGSYAEAIEGAGFKITSMEIEAQALARCLIPNSDPATFMIVDFGSTRTGFTVVSRGQVLFTSTVGIGGDEITEAISKKLNITLEMARKVKEKQGLSRALPNRANFETIAPVVSVLRDELNKHYLYWNTHVGESVASRRSIEEIFMCGGDANIPGLVEYLSAGVSIPIRLANPWTNVVKSFDEEIPVIPFNHALRFATAMGLALKRFSA